MAQWQQVHHQLIFLLLHGVLRLTHRAKFADFLAKQPWGDKSNQYFYTREEEYVHGLRCALGIW